MNSCGRLTIIGFLLPFLIVGVRLKTVETENVLKVVENHSIRTIVGNDVVGSSAKGNVNCAIHTLRLYS